MFHFTSDDLEANRAGRLSDGQAQGFKDGNRHYLIGALVLFCVFALMSLITFSDSFDAPRNLPQTLLIFTGIAGIGVGLAWYGRNETFSPLKKILETALTLTEVSNPKFP